MRMAEWSPECVRCRWIGGATHPPREHGSVARAATAGGAGPPPPRSRRCVPASCSPGTSPTSDSPSPAGSTGSNRTTMASVSSRRSRTVVAALLRAVSPYITGSPGPVQAQRRHHGVHAAGDQGRRRSHHLRPFRACDSRVQARLPARRRWLAGMTATQPAATAGKRTALVATGSEQLATLATAGDTTPLVRISGPGRMRPARSEVPRPMCHPRP